MLHLSSVPTQLLYPLNFQCLELQNHMKSTRETHLADENANPC